MKKFFLLVFVIASVAKQSYSQSVWTQKSNFSGTPRSDAVGFSIGAKGYIGTGGDITREKDFWEWDQVTNVWTQKADFGGTARVAAVGFSIGTKGYIGTGYDGIAPSWDTNDFWEYDPTTNVWTQKTNFGGTARDHAVGFSIGNKGYIGTGDHGNDMQDFWEWDQATNVWTQKINFGGTARSGAVGFSIGAKGYIGTGEYNHSLAYNDFWEWDQALNTWTQKANFGGTARVAAVGFSIGTKGYIGTGYDGIANNIYYQDFWEWNQSTNIWTQKNNFPDTVRRSAIGFSIGTKGYIGTGCRGDAEFFNGFWEYCDTCIGAGANEINFSKSISIYPNPTNGKFRIVNDELRITNLDIYNIRGEKVYSSTQQLSSVIDISSQHSGVYFLQLKTLDGVAMKKIVKE